MWLQIWSFLRVNVDFLNVCVAAMLGSIWLLIEFDLDYIGSELGLRWVEVCEEFLKCVNERNSCKFDEDNLWIS